MIKKIAIVSADKEIIELCREVGFEVVGFFDKNVQAAALGVQHLGGDEAWRLWKEKIPDLKVVIAFDLTALKEKLANYYGFESLETVISSRAYVSQTAHIGIGCLIQQGVKIFSNARVGIGCKMNVNAVIHHDSQVGNFCTLAPGSHILGTVTIQDKVFVGAGAVILPKVTVGSGSIVGAGAVVLHDVPAGTTVAGVPARNLHPEK